jgi:hypothetical protein
VSVREEQAGGEQLRAIGEAAEALWDAARRSQDLLDELEDERLGRWAAYTAFREVGAVFRFALERLRMEETLPELSDAVGAYRAGARAGLEACADLVDAVREGGEDSVEMGIQRLTLASQQFVRGRFLLQRYLDETNPDSAEAEDGAP